MNPGLAMWISFMCGWLGATAVFVWFKYNTAAAVLSGILTLLVYTLATVLLVLGEG
jgi:hypothetical protein